MAKNKDELFTQCKLRKPVEKHYGHYYSMTSWIPKVIAKKGNVVKLKERKSDEKWSENWEVVEVGSTKPLSYLEEHERDYKHQREFSDV